MIQTFESVVAQAAADGGVVSLLCYRGGITARAEKQKALGLGKGRRAPADSPASSLLFLSLIDPPRSCAHFSLISNLLFQQRSRRVYISSLLLRSPSTTPPPHLSYSSFLDNHTSTDPHHLYTASSYGRAHYAHSFYAQACSLALFTEKKWPDKGRKSYAKTVHSHTRARGWASQRFRKLQSHPVCSNHYN